MKQTAVEFLYSEYKRIFGDILVKPSQGIQIADALAQAKEIEKKQIVNACTYGNRQEFYDAEETMGEQYYNEQFKKK